MANKGKIMIATPCFGGLVYDGYLISAIQTTRFLLEQKVEFMFYTISNESLINRARNSIASFVLENPDISHLMFIDADISWTLQDFANLVNAQKPIVGGTYALKSFPIRMNLNLLDDDIKKYGHTKTADHLELLKEKIGDKDGLVKVRHIPTGFLLIRREVLEDLKNHVESYVHKDKDKLVTHYNLFSVGVRDNILESEDWFFCSLARKHGYDIYLDPTVIVKHSGTYCFAPPPKTVPAAATPVEKVDNCDKK